MHDYSATFLLACGLVLSGCASYCDPASNTAAPILRGADLPIVQEHGYALVSVTIAGVPDLWFVVDSAASSSVISPSTRDALGLGKNASQANVTGGSGQASYQAVELPKFSFGGQNFEKLGAVVVDLSRFESTGSGRKIAGLIGNDVLRRFDWALDMPRAVLKLRERGTTKASTLAGSDRCVANVADSDAWVAMDVLLNGVKVHAVVDTAAGRSIFNWTAARAAGVTRETPGVTRAQVEARGLGAQKASETFVHRFAKVEVEPVVFTPTESRIADLPVFGALGLAEKPAVIFGTNYVADRVMAVSYPDRQICFSDPVRI